MVPRCRSIETRRRLPPDGILQVAFSGVAMDHDDCCYDLDDCPPSEILSDILENRYNDCTKLSKESLASICKEFPCPERAEPDQSEPLRMRNELESLFHNAMDETIDATRRRDCFLRIQKLLSLIDQALLPDETTNDSRGGHDATAHSTDENAVTLTMVTPPWTSAATPTSQSTPKEVCPGGNETLTPTSSSDGMEESPPGVPQQKPGDGFVGTSGSAQRSPPTDDTTVTTIDLDSAAVVAECSLEQAESSMVVDEPVAVDDSCGALATDERMAIPATPLHRNVGEMPSMCAPTAVHGALLDVRGIDHTDQNQREPSTSDKPKTVIASPRTESTVDHEQITDQQRNTRYHRRGDERTFGGLVQSDRSPPFRYTRTESIHAHLLDLSGIEELDSTHRAQTIPRMGVHSHLLDFGGMEESTSAAGGSEREVKGTQLLHPTRYPHPHLLEMTAVEDEERVEASCGSHHARLLDLDGLDQTERAGAPNGAQFTSTNLPTAQLPAPMNGTPVHRERSNPKSPNDMDISDEEYIQNPPNVSQRASYGSLLTSPNPTPTDRPLGQENASILSQRQMPTSPEAMDTSDDEPLTSLDSCRRPMAGSAPSEGTRSQSGRPTPEDATDRASHSTGTRTLQQEARGQPGRPNKAETAASVRFSTSFDQSPSKSGGDSLSHGSLSSTDDSPTTPSLINRLSSELSNPRQSKATSQKAQPVSVSTKAKKIRTPKPEDCTYVNYVDPELWQSWSWRERQQFLTQRKERGARMAARRK